jgi:uncharacterized protein
MTAGGRATFVAISLALIVYSGATAFGKLAPWPYIAANLAIAALALALAHQSGVTMEELGLGRDGLRRGILWGGGSAVLIVLVVLGGAFVIAQFATSVGNEGADPPGGVIATGDVLFKVFIRILFGTAVAEEAIFRGALLALWAKSRGAKEALLGSSVAFALWHIGPSIVNQSAEGSSDASIALYTALSLGGTFVGGLILVWLRRRASGIVAPVLVHAAVNGSLVAAGHMSF